MKITPTTLTINQLLGSSNEQFFIPAYQRRYSWEQKQWADLFNDINLLNQEDSHLLGNILCLTTNYSAGINKLELVDGQQRITTLTILIKALSTKFKEHNIDDVHKELEALLTCKSIERVEKRKLVLGELDDPDYIKFLNSDDRDSMINERFVESYNFFMDKLNEFALQDLYKFEHKLRSNTFTIRLDVAHAKDAYKLFETINNRGLSLSPTDIIKNFLLGHASLISEDTLEKIRNYWTELITNLDGINTDDFFRQYLSSTLKRKVTGSNTISEFKKLYFNIVIEAESLNEFSKYQENTEFLEEELDESPMETDENTQEENDNNKISIIQFSKRLRNASKIYSQIRNKTFENKGFNKHLTHLTKIKSFPSYIFLMDLFGRNVNDQEKTSILQLVEIFMLRRHICEYRTGELDTIFSSMVNIEDQNIAENVKNHLTKHLPGDTEFKEKFSRYNFGENRAKYVLEQFEYDLINDQGEYLLTSGNELQLEHIIPQKIKTKKSQNEYGDWIDYLGGNAIELHKEYVNKIGNLTLIAGTLNLGASNNPFERKVTEYKKSNIKLTLDITDFDEFTFKEVEYRSKMFSEKAVKIWSF